MTNFTELDLDATLLEALANKGFHHPTMIQAETIPVALAGRDIIGSAPTGTGKTAAFLLPAIQYLLDFPRKKAGAPRILILTPTRELALQVAEQAKELAAYTHLDIATITGGVAYMNHAEIFSKNQDIIVATTGRLLQYIKEENFDCRAIEMLILDEADRMLDMGFSQDIEVISAETRWRKQTLLFSATMEGELLVDFAERILTEPVIIEANPSRRERKKILQCYYRADDLAHKKQLLGHLLTQPDLHKAIVFVRKRERLHELVRWLRDTNIRCFYLEGDMPQTRRNAALTHVKNGTANVLVATDVAARGIDISDISHVINFDLPRTADVYLHRIGRTGRAGKKGVAISLVESHDHLLLEKIGRYLNEPLKKRVIDSLRPKSKAPSATTFSQLKKKKSKKKKATNSEAKEKVKVRLRDKKNIGKRRKPSSPSPTVEQQQSSD